SIFYANNTISAFHGESPDIATCGIKHCLIPDHLVRLRMDGSVATTSWQRWKLPTQTMIFSWEGPFFFAE
ncbi:MAG: hypothetical protein NT023_15780, partial [Armatimonadetes bacterium]|nr:hypothetical protein [Armatimonadota bacterium]